MRASSHGSVVPPGATSLRLMAELPGASLTLRSALAPPTDDGLRALRVAASVAADGGGALRRSLTFTLTLPLTFTLSLSLSRGAPAGAVRGARL